MISAGAYSKLLTKYAPQPIHSAAAHRRALAQLEELMVRHPDEATGRIIELLSMLVEKYESRELPTPNVAPVDMLAHLLESTGIKPVQVAKATGIPPATLSNVLARRRGVSKVNAVKLGTFFGVSPLVFIVEVKDGRKLAKRKGRPPTPLPMNRPLAKRA